MGMVGRSGEAHQADSVDHRETSNCLKQTTGRFRQSIAVILFVFGQAGSGCREETRKDRGGAGRRTLQCWQQVGSVQSHLGGETGSRMTGTPVSTGPGSPAGSLIRSAGGTRMNVHRPISLSDAPTQNSGMVASQPDLPKGLQGRHCHSTQHRCVERPELSTGPLHVAPWGARRCWPSAPSSASGRKACPILSADHIAPPSPASSARGNELLCLSHPFAQEVMWIRPNTEAPRAQKGFRNTPGGGGIFSVVLWVSTPLLLLIL